MYGLLQVLCMLFSVSAVHSWPTDLFLGIKKDWIYVPKGTDAFGNTRIFTAAASSLDNASESEEYFFSQDDESNAVSNNNDVLDIGVSEPRSGH